MLHPGPLVAEDVVVTVEPGASPTLDALAAAEAGEHAFLRAAWFGAPLATVVARRAGSGAPIAAIPFAARPVGPISLRQVAGSYWPYRLFPIARDASEADLAALLASPAARRALGRVWRLGPIPADDPSLGRLQAAARWSGWALLVRRLATLYVVDLEALKGQGDWPSGKTLRKNRWFERRLAEAGALEFRTVSGEAWSADTFDLLARVEAESWVGRAKNRRDTKFLDPGNRRGWEHAVSDPALAAMLRCSLLLVGGRPAAFTFGLECGGTLHIVANSYSEQFREASPGRVLLYREFERAAQAGATRVEWGAGDPGYKTNMGARPGADLVDLLMVRGRIPAALARPVWKRI